MNDEVIRAVRAYILIRRALDWLWPIIVAVSLLLSAWNTYTIRKRIKILEAALSDCTCSEEVRYY